jgi:quinol monooxygenase YgiN
MRLLRGIGKIKPEQRKAFLQAVNSQIQAALKEEGVIEFAAYQSIEDPNIFVLIEVYRDAAAQEQHNTQSYTQAFERNLADYLAAPPDIKIMDGDWLAM